MALSIDWGNKIINVLRADLTLIQSTPTEIRQLDLDAFRLDLKDLEDSSDGMAFERTHKHNTSVTVGGVVLARVIEIINGYTITFEDGQYAVNLVGANSNVGDVVNVNQVSVRSANSAGLQDLSTLLASAYQGRVVIDTVNGQAGTSTPIGTFSTPSDNVIDAVRIAINNGLEVLLFMNNITINEDLSAGYSLVGSSLFTNIIFNTIADISNCYIKNLTISGDLDSVNTIEQCILGIVSNVSGHIKESGFTNLITLNGGLIITQSYSQIQGLGFAEFNIGSNNIVIRDFHGSIGITNMTGGTHSIGLEEGRLILDATNTAGTIFVRGTPFDIDDLSIGTVVTDQTESKQVRQTHGQTTRCIFVDTELIPIGNGYQQTPYNNWTSAIDDAEALNLKRIQVISDATLDRQLKNFSIEGLGLPAIDLNAQNIDNTIFTLCELTGSHTGTMQAIECAVNGLSGMAGVFFTVSIQGTISPASGGDGLLLWECTPAIAGSPWTLDMGAAGAGTVGIQNSTAGVIIINMTDPGDLVHFHGLQGQLVIDSTCTSGTIVVTGDIGVVDNSTGTSVNKDLTSSNLTWDVDKNTLTSANTIGNHVAKKLLTTTKFLGLK